MHRAPVRTMTALALLTFVLLAPSSGFSRLPALGTSLSPTVLLRTPSGDPDGNDSPGTATIIAMPHQGDYAIDPAGDVDWYRMELGANTLLHIYSERINDSQLDPEARLYGPHSADGNDLDPTDWIAVDDDSHGDVQPDIRIVIPESGFYFLRMAYYQNDPTRGSNEPKESNRADTGAYRLFVEELADQPDIWVDPDNLDFGLTPHDSANASISVSNQGNAPLHVSSISDDQPWLSLSVDSLTVPPDSSLDVIATANSTGLGLGTHIATISITSDDPDQSSIAIDVVLTVAWPDTNDMPPEATPISVPHTGDYVIGTVGDVDWYRMYLHAGTWWAIHTERIDGSQIDPEAWLYGPHAADGSDVDPTDWIANDDDSYGGLQPLVEISVTETGNYFLRIAYFANNPSARVPEHKTADRAATGEYRLFIQPGTGADDAPRPSSLLLGISPNPASDRIDLAIRLQEETLVSTAIYDLSGRVVLQPVTETLGSGDQVVHRDLHTVEDGAYLVRVQAGALTESRRILVRR
ncbi:T9SS type A sorting domain-containing protein [Candidatus Fermentibacteria bacterium]|nr:T9SS type A sorting domain-containing protein [Candidatus Fermentibacteria bacterium]